MQALAKMMMGFTVVFMPGVFVALILAPVRVPAMELRPELEQLQTASQQPPHRPPPPTLAHETWQFCHTDDAEIVVVVSLACPGVFEPRVLRVPLRGGTTGADPWQGSVFEDRRIDDSDWSEWINFTAEVSVSLQGSSVLCSVEASWFHDRHYDRWQARCIEGETEEQASFELSELLQPRAVALREGITLTCQVQPARPPGSRQ